MAGGEMHEGLLGGVLPCLTFGAGPPLLVCAGLSPEHANPTGMMRRIEVGPYRPLGEHATVHFVSRRPGLAAGTTMADLARDGADAVRDAFAGPVPVVGVSTGGSVALQLAADHPDVVSCLVVHASACRLSDAGRGAQRQVAADAAAGRWRDTWATLMGLSAGGRAAELGMRAFGWLVGPRFAVADPTDMIRTIEAEDAFDLTDRLGEIRAPTLVVGGARDRFYTPELFRRTAQGVPDGRLVLLPRAGHAASVTSKHARTAMERFLHTA